MRTLLIAVLALLPVLSAAEQSATNNLATNPPAATTPLTASGIRGVVERWPVSPVSRAGKTNSMPLPNVTVSVKSQIDKTVIARQKTDQNGRFEFKLPPGKYIIAPMLQPGLRFRAAEQSAEVQDKKFTEVVVRYDTGLR